MSNKLPTPNSQLPTRILVTGCAGFIGFNTTKALLARGDSVVGLDNINAYYSTKLKNDRLAVLKKDPRFTFIRGDVSSQKALNKLFIDNKIDKVCHLAAQAGVRYSLENPAAYIKSNIVGFTTLIEEVKKAGIETFIYASSSSVYGNNKTTPFSEDDFVGRPISIYAATKRADELIAYTYHHLYGIKCTGLRFFTAYGPWGRPDMAYFSFTKDILAGKTIKVFNNGEMKRDFTYIDDIVSGILAALDKSYGYEIFNLGNNKPITLAYFISSIEKNLGIKAKKEYLPAQPGDMIETCANLDHSFDKLNYKPRVSFAEGIKQFVSWYKEYYS